MKTICEKQLKAICEVFSEERKRTISGIWKAYEKTLDIPYRKLTDAEKEIGSLFLSIVLRIDVENGVVYYVTPYETFSH